VPGGDRVPGLQELELLAQSGGELGHREPVQLGGGQLDGQREPVELLADLQDGALVVRPDGEARHDGPGALGEQDQSRVPVLGAGRRGTLWIGYRQRGNAPHVLSHHPEHLPAGAHHPESGRGAQRAVYESGAGVQQVLAVVQHQQQFPVPQVPDDHFGRRLVGGDIDAQGLGDRVPDHGAIGHWGEIDQPYAVSECPAQLPGNPDGEAGLTAAAYPGEGDQPGARQQPLHLHDVLSAADEAGQLGGDMARPVAGTTT
jgi:hypothetical protein